MPPRVFLIPPKQNGQEEEIHLRQFLASKITSENHDLKVARANLFYVIVIIPNKDKNIKSLRFLITFFFSETSPGEIFFYRSLFLTTSS